MYVGDSNDFMPVCGWPSGQNPWQTYSACRVAPDGVTITRGFMGLGLLFRTKAVPNAKVFYCPSAKNAGESRTYENYSTKAPWPSTPDGSDQVRTFYTYYPQLKAVEPVGSVLLPRLIFSLANLEISDNPNIKMVVTKQSQIDLNKAISTDQIYSLSTTAHREKSSTAGLNALFADGHVLFQTSRQNPNAFTTALWGKSEDDNVGDEPPPSPRFRTLMNTWKP